MDKQTVPVADEGKRKKTQAAPDTIYFSKKQETTMVRGSPIISSSYGSPSTRTTTTTTNTTPTAVTRTTKTRSSSSLSSWYATALAATGSVVLLWQVKTHQYHKHPVVKDKIHEWLLWCRRWRYQLVSWRYQALYWLEKHIPPQLYPTLLSSSLWLNNNNDNDDDNDTSLSPCFDKDWRLSPRERADRLEEWVRRVRERVERYRVASVEWSERTEREFQTTQAQLRSHVRTMEQVLGQHEQLHERRIRRYQESNQAWLETVNLQLHKAQKRLMEWKHDQRRRQQQQPVVATTTTNRTTIGSNANGNTAVATELAPPPVELSCPITWDLMKDPVLLVDDGHTYERSAIENVLFGGGSRGGVKRSPKTNQPLSDHPTLVPNIAIRSMCRDYEEQQKEFQANQQQQQQQQQQQSNNIQ